MRRNYPHMPPPAGPYAHAVKYGGLLFVSGITAYGSLSEGGPLAYQAEYILEQLAGIAEAVPRRFSAATEQIAILHWVETIFNRHTLLSGVCAHISGSRRLFSNYGLFFCLR